MMKLFVVFVLVLHVSHDALGGEVMIEVDESATVTLPCQVMANKFPDATIEWKRGNPSMTVHVRINNRDQPNDQNEVYRGRTELPKDPLISGDLTLTLSDVTMIDSATYSCIVRSGPQELDRKEIQLKVNSQEVRRLEKEKTIAAAFAGIFGILAAVLLGILVVGFMKKQKRRSIPGTPEEAKQISG